MATSTFFGEQVTNRRGKLALAFVALMCLGLFVVPAMAKAAAPEVSLQQAAGQDDPTNSSAIEFSLTSNESLVGGSVTTSDFSATNGSVDSITEVGPAEYTINVTAAGDGAVVIAPSETFEVTDLDEALTQDTAAGADRSVTYDGTAPTVVLEQAIGQADPTNNASIDFTFSSDENLDSGTVEASDFDLTNATLDTLTGAGDEYTISVIASSDGAVSVAPSGTFSVSDEVGNAQTSAGGADRSVTYDGTAPTVSLQVAGGQDDPTVSSTIQFELTSDEDLNPASVTDSDFAAVNGTVTGVTGADDLYTITVTATGQGPVTLAPTGTFSVSDLAGNSQANTAGGNPQVLYDTAPVLTLEQAAGQDDPTNTTPVQFTLSSNEDLNGSTVDNSDFDITNGTIAGINTVGNQATIDVTPTADGDVSIAPSGTFSVEDTNGNFPTTTADGTDRTVTVDTDAPTTSLVGNPTDPSVDRTPTFDLQSDEDGTFQCRLWEDSDTPPAFAPCLDPYNSAFLPEGNYNFEAFAVDEVGNEGNTVGYVWAVEASDIVAGPEEAVYFTRGDTPVEIKVVAEDSQPGSFSYEFLNSLGGGTMSAFTVDPSGGTATYTPGDGFAGEDTLNVRVRNTSTGGTVDTQVTVVVRPVSKLNSGPGVGPTPQLTNDDTPTFTYSAVAGPNEGVVPGATFACKIDGSAMSNSACNTGSITTAALSEGEHTFTVKASKPSINPDSSLASVTFTVDTVIPGVPTLDGPSGLINSNDPSWTFTTPEGSAQCRLLSDADPDPAWGACGSPKEYNDLADGAYEFQVRTIDAALNVSSAVTRSVLIDTVVDVTIDSAPVDGNLDALPAIEFSSPEDPDVAYECRLYPSAAAPEDIPAYAACSSPEQLAFLDQNISYHFDVRGTDDAGNTDVASTEWLQSNTAPAIVEPTVTLEAGTSAPVNLGGSDADSDVITYSITGPVTGGTLGTIDQDTGLVDFSAAADASGEYTFAYQVTDDRQGGTVSGTATILVQPNTFFVTEPPAETNDTTPTWTFDSPADSVDTFECNLDGGGWEACDSGSYTPAVDLPEGSHTLEVRATDGALADPTPSSSSTIVDITTPDINITSTPVALSNEPNPVFEFESTDGTAALECSVDLAGSPDPVTYDACDSGDGFGPLTDGHYVFSVRSTDPGGNVSAPDTYAWEVDATLPVVALGGNPVGVPNGPGEGEQTNAKKPLYYFTTTDTNLVDATTTCWIDGQTALNPCLSPFQQPTNLNDGAHTLHLTTEDAAGNLREFSVNFTVDTLSASVAFGDTPSSPSGPSADFTFTASTPLGAEGFFECRTSFNGGAPGPWSTCASPLQLTGLSSGTRKLEVRAVDSAGNASTGGGIASHTWTTIGGAPDTAITGSNKSGNTASFGFNSPGNPLATFECKIDAAAFASCTSTKTYNNLSVGSHTFSVRATNQVQTVDATPASSTWSVSAPTAPDTEITREPVATTNLTDATFEFESSDPLGTFECAMDSGAFAACDSPKSYTGLAMGSHTFKVRSTSGALTDSSPDTSTWTIRDKVVDPGEDEVCNPQSPHAVKTNEAKVARGLTASVTISHSKARPGQTVEVKLNGSARKKAKIAKSVKKIVVSSGGTVLSTLRAKAWASTFTVTESQADNLTIKFVRKKGKAVKKPAAFTVLPACNQ